MTSVTSRFPFVSCPKGRLRNSRSLFQASRSRYLLSQFYCAESMNHSPKQAFYICLTHSNWQNKQGIDSIVLKFPHSKREPGRQAVPPAGGALVAGAAMPGVEAQGAVAGGQSRSERFWESNMFLCFLWEVNFWTCLKKGMGPFPDLAVNLYILRVGATRKAVGGHIGVVFWIGRFTFSPWYCLVTLSGLRS